MNRDERAIMGLLGREAGSAHRDRAHALARWIGGASQERLKRIDLALRVHLATHMLARTELTPPRFAETLPEPVRRQAARLLRSCEPEPELRRREHIALDSLAHEIRRAPGRIELRRDWRRLGRADRRQALQHIADRYSALLGVEPPRVALYEQPPRNGMLRQGHYSESGPGTVRVNDLGPSADRAGIEPADFDTQLGILIHELTHHLQFRLKAAARDGRLGPGQPGFLTGMVAALHGAPPLKRKVAADPVFYAEQTIERHARASQQRLMRHMGAGRGLDRVLGTGPRPPRQHPPPLIPPARQRAPAPPATAKSPEMPGETPEETPRGKSSTRAAGRPDPRRPRG